MSDRATLLAIAQAAERALHDSERHRLARNAVEYLRARRRCAMHLEQLVLKLGEPVDVDGPREALRDLLRLRQMEGDGMPATGWRQAWDAAAAAVAWHDGPSAADQERGVG